MKQLADVLRELGMLTDEQLAAAYDGHRRGGRSLGRVLVEQQMITEAQLVAALASQLGLPFVELTGQRVDPAALAAVPAALCRRHVLLPLRYEDGRLLLAMSDPANGFAIEDVRSVSGAEPRVVVATRQDLLAAIDRQLGAVG